MIIEEVKMMENKKTKLQYKDVRCSYCGYELGKVVKGVYGDVYLLCPRCNNISDKHERYIPWQQAWR